MELSKLKLLASIGAKKNKVAQDMVSFDFTDGFAYAKNDNCAIKVKMRKQQSGQIDIATIGLTTIVKNSDMKQSVTFKKHKDVDLIISVSNGIRILNKIETGTASRYSEIFESEHTSFNVCKPTFDHILANIGFGGAVIESKLLTDIDNFIRSFKLISKAFIYTNRDTKLVKIVLFSGNSIVLEYVISNIGQINLEQGDE